MYRSVTVLVLVPPVYVALCAGVVLSVIAGVPTTTTGSENVTVTSIFVPEP